MRDPRDERFQKIQSLMASGAMVGADRPVGRVTWAKEGVRTVKSQIAGVGTLRYVEILNAPEIDMSPAVVSIEINRGIGQDAATCTIRMVNQWGSTSAPEGVDTYMRPGFMTPGRGEKIPPYSSVYNKYADGGGIADAENEDNPFPTDWGYARNMYRDAFIPNTVLRTYQGYGSDNFDIDGNPKYVHDPSSVGWVHPRDDSKLYLTGIWLIDRVMIGSDGSMTFECRDLAKLLIEQYIYPPMIPVDRFPLIYCPAFGPSGHHESIGRNVASYHSSSVDPWYGKNASVYGHRGSHACDGSQQTFWLSVANGQPNEYYSYEWVQVSTSGKVNEVVLNTKGANYMIYVSVYENGAWQGTQTVPYLPQPPGFPNGSNIKYVTSVTQGSNEKITIVLPRTYNAKFVRVTFSNLQNLGYNGYPYRAGLRDFVVRNHVGNTFKPGRPDGMVGKDGIRYIKDWSEPIKELCAWAGFTWRDASPNAPDPMFGRSTTGKPLQVWGDFEELGAGPVVCTPGDYFISKSFMEGIRQIVDFIGGIFFVDEYGGANFRLPNIWTGGNYITDPQSSFLDARINGHPIEFHENANLTNYSLVIDDSQVRSEVLVIGGYPNVHASGPVAGGYVLGYNSATNTTSAIDFTDVLAGQTRLFAVPNDATKLFYTERECQRMAELVALFILFSYRKGSVTAPCHPGLQVDDQVRIFERQTYEHYVHYVSNIRTSMDLMSGEYTMEVTTHWLGKDPNTVWFVDKAQLTPAVLQLPAIQKRVGREAGGDNFEQPPYGT